ncbi:hypothetical protein JIQ42_02411 [Leishmania sp. Namibia]|uniref:hypothetical protein n=1 Tax=Leishmania sp. Namibia TaxID=2802991 RepID=UPI001B4AAB40|nr:hypothetical protein JIQ42_02411 [Leishmania sp. Namibia]
MHRVPVTVSFDALGTLIQITHGLGYQYRSSYAAFLKNYGVDLDASCPNATCALMQELALKAIHDRVRADRATWTRSTDPREMPIGGDTDEDLRSFWSCVLRQTYSCPALYKGAASDVVQRVEALWANRHSEVRRFEEYVLFDQFGSTKAYSWHPRALHALRCLREWNRQQKSCFESATRSASAATTPVAALSFAPSVTTTSATAFFLAAPPFVVSNMDPRIRGVFTLLGAFEPGARDEPPLLSRVISAQDVGYAKPSPIGILTGVRHIADSHRAACQRNGGVCGPGVHVRLHVHVGDAEADRVACERAGCHFLRCDLARGATWKSLHAKLRELEASYGAAPLASNDTGVGISE